MTGGLLFRQLCRPVVMASVILGAASFCCIQVLSVSMALFQVSVAPGDLHFRICSFVSFGCLHPGHSADFACFLIYKAWLVPQKPLFHLITSFLFAGVILLNAAPRLLQFMWFVAFGGMFILLFQYSLVLEEVMSS